MEKKNFFVTVLFFCLWFGLYDCSYIEAEAEAHSHINCQDGIDNDFDGLIDIDEAWCHSDLDVDNPNSYRPFFEGEFDDEGYTPQIYSLKQYTYDGSEEIYPSALINENKISLRISISDEDRDECIVFRYKGYCLENPNITISGETDQIFPEEGSWYKFDETVDIKIENLENCSYVWKALVYDFEGNVSGYKEFGNNSNTEPDFVVSDNFSFVHITDVHIGSNKALLAVGSGNSWYESQSYPRFTDVLYEIEKEVSPRPDFVLVGGDDVEYNNTTWLRDFKAITDDFSKRTGIKVYVVPGNHDRYDSESSGISLGESNLSGGNDHLHNYLEVMQNNPNVTSFFEDNSEIMNATESQDGGLNKYNYSFYHKGMQFIGLDSGEDTGVWDTKPESSGFSEQVINSLRGISDEKIIFTHGPIFNDKLSFEWDNGLFLGEIVPDESFIHNWRNFINYCNNNNVQMVLSGHTHQNKTFDANGDLMDLSNWNGSYPLYIQTQSATKDGDNNMHGYRVVDIIGGKAIPREPVTGVKKYTKILSDLDTNHNITMQPYDSSGRMVRIPDNTLNPSKKIPFFAPASKRTIMYEDTGMSRFILTNYNNSYGEYDFLIQRRDEGMEPTGDLWSFSGLKIKNADLCAGNPNCASFLAIKKSNGQKVDTLDFWGMDIDRNSRHAIEVNWTELQNSSLTEQIDGLRFIVNDNYNTTYEKMPWVHVIDLNSPGELRVFGPNGEVTGLVDGEMKSEIPYSFYVPETETVFLFGDTQSAVTQGIATQVVGSYSATYDLSFSLQESEEEKARVFADDIPTDGETIHQFSVDWQALSEGDRGVSVQFDENADGQFEKSLDYGSLVTANSLLADAGGNYESTEGSEILFNASNSSSSSGSIVLYEWDVNDDGVYEVSSTLPEIGHTYGDDYVGKISLRITDDLGTVAVDSADIVVKNANPSAEINKVDSSSLSEELSFDVSLSDSGWLDVHTISIDWGDGSVQNVLIDEKNISPTAYGKANVSHKYLPIKDYVIKLTVTDDDGGVGVAQFVIPSPKQLKIDALAELKAMTVDDKSMRKELDRAIKNLESSLSEKYWQDDFHLDYKHGHKMFNEEKQAMQSLAKILKVKKSPASPEIQKDIKDLMTQLLQSDILLLQVMLSEQDLEVKNPTLKKNMDSVLKDFKLKIGKSLKNADYSSSPQAFDGFDLLRF